MPPDILLVMTDQQRHDQVGSVGGGFFETPNLDALAAGGVQFTTAYSADTTCVPARNALLTGVLPHRLPVQYSKLALREGVWTVAHALRGAGYDTALIGKMHFTPMHADHGFDFVRTSEHLGASQHELRRDGSPDLDDYSEWLVSQGVAWWSHLVEGQSPRLDTVPASPDADGTDFPHELRYHVTTWIERQVAEYLSARRSTKPLFLVVSFPHPHRPLNPLGRYRTLYDEHDAVLPKDGFEVNEGLPDEFRAAFDPVPGARFRPTLVDRDGVEGFRGRLTKTRALVRHIDDAFGRIIDRVDRKRTVVIFTSDHGDYAGHRGLEGKVPWISFDDLLRVPLTMAGPGIQGPRRIESVVQTSDLALTCCELAGVDVPIEAFDARSLVPLFDHATAPDRDRIVVFSTSMGWPGARRGAMKLIRHQRFGTSVLFDLEQDPGETVDLAEDRAYRDVRRELEIVTELAFRREEFSLQAPVADPEVGPPAMAGVASGGEATGPRDS